jgi:hypothetical protein
MCATQPEPGLGPDRVSNGCFDNVRSESINLDEQTSADHS